MSLARGVAIAALVCAAPSLARAQQAPESNGVLVARARQEFEAGVRLLEDSRFAEAAAALERSVALRESPAALYNLGLAYRGAGAHRRAIVVFMRFLGTPAAQENAQLRSGARALVAELRAGLVRVRLQVAGGAHEVLIDGGRVGDRDFQREFELDPGEHVFEARRRGYAPARNVARFDAGARGAVALDVAARPLPATIVVETSTARAPIRIDGELVGLGRQARGVIAGRHEVEVAFGGQDVQRRAVDAAAGARVLVSLAPHRYSVAEQWWFWTSLGGALAAAAVVTAVVIATRPAEQVRGTWETANAP